MKKKLAVLAAVVSGVYLFVPEPTDVFPFIGWLDEGAALAILGWSLRSLGVSPSSFFRRREKVVGETVVEETKALDKLPA